MQEKIFINHTNHASINWSAEQIAAAESYGKIIDLPFPEVPPNFTTEEVKQLALENLQEILKLSPTVVLCHGEFSYTVSMVEELKKIEIPVMAATSERIVSEITDSDGLTKKIFCISICQIQGVLKIFLVKSRILNYTKKDGGRKSAPQTAILPRIATPFVKGRV